MKERVRKLEENIKATRSQSQSRSICKQSSIPAEKGTEAPVKERTESLLYQRE